MGDLPPISGRRGELLARLLHLLDRSPADQPAWWFEYGLVITGPLRVDTRSAGAQSSLPDRPAFISAIRQRLMTVCTHEIDEEWLVPAARRSIDAWVERRADVAARNEWVQKLRAAYEETINDSIALEAWRQELAETDPHWAVSTDEELVAEVERLLETKPSLQLTDADESLARWAHRDAWISASDEALSDAVIEQWKELRLIQANRGG